jgi:hypothetical protein
MEDVLIDYYLSRGIEVPSIFWAYRLRMFEGGLEHG